MDYGIIGEKSFFLCFLLQASFRIVSFSFSYLNILLTLLLYWNVVYCCMMCFLLYDMTI